MCVCVYIFFIIDQTRESKYFKVNRSANEFACVTFGFISYNYLKLYEQIHLQTNSLKKNSLFSVLRHKAWNNGGHQGRIETLTMVY